MKSKETSMKSIGRKFGKYEKIMTKLEKLTELAFRNHFYMYAMKKAEEELYRMIQKEQKKINTKGQAGNRDSKRAA